MTNVFNEDDDFLGTVEWQGVYSRFTATGYPNAGYGVNLGFFETQDDAEKAVVRWHEQ